MSLAIRPVTRRFPASFELWEETNLPLAVVVQPLDSTQDREGEALQQQAQRQQKSQHPPLLTHIPKCLHCGAPHPDARTHYAPPRKTIKDPMASPYARPSSQQSHHHSSVLLCYLCGKMSSTRLDQQINERREEGAQNVSGTEEYRRLSPQTTHTFALPLRLPPSSQQQQSPHLSYQIPAMACPPLWFWILDGTATDRSYWHTVSETLQTCLAQLPPFVHVSLLLACRQDRGVGIFQLGSAVPHVQYYPYATSTLTYAGSSSKKAVPSHAHNGVKNSAVVDEDDAVDNEAAVALLRQRMMQSLVPADGSHVDHIQAALRSLLDVHSLVESDTLSNPSTITSAADPHHHAAPSPNVGMPLAETLTHLSEALLTFGHAAGQKPTAPSTDNNLLFGQKDADNEFEQLPYAGGKVTVLLANRPADLPYNTTSPAANSYYNPYLASATSSGDLDDSASSSLYSYGGWGGRTAPRGGGGGGSFGDYAPPSDPAIPFYSDDTNQDEDEEDIEKLSDFFAELGRQCADAALGVDILGLVSSLTNGLHCHDKDLGLVALGGLSYKSGAAGPLLFDLHQPEARRNLAVEVQSRSPWLVLQEGATSSQLQEQQQQRVFGAELRLRLSRGFSVDDTAIEPPTPASSEASKARRKKEVKKKQRFYDGFDDDNQGNGDDDAEDEDSLSEPFLACLHGEKGLVGPACAVPDEDTLWRMGTCDPFTAFSIDLDMAGSSGGNKKRRGSSASTVPQDVMVDGWGRIPLKAVMQTCFAYTTVIKGNDDEYYTVRRIRISSCPVPLAHDAETIYNAVDPEATAVILFHKLTVACFQEGLLATRAIATDWLQSLLTCVYRSAEDQESIELELKENGVEETASGATFFPTERLLHQEGGTLSDEDVLLAQGHARLKTFPLMTYLLLQCDAFRRHHELSAATALSSNMDLRYAALYQMACMTPEVLTRCLAPILQLWAAASADGDDQNGDEPILDMIDLRASAVDQAIKEYRTNPQSSPLILFMDTPYQMLLLNANAVVSTQEDDSKSGGRHRKSTPPGPPVVGPALAAAVQEAASRYRTRPPMIRALDINSSRANESNTTRAVQHIWDACLEDVASEGDTFARWKTAMAEKVHEELREDEDFEENGAV